MLVSYVSGVWLKRVLAEIETFLKSIPLLFLVESRESAY